jgi:hypothetical protein
MKNFIKTTIFALAILACGTTTFAQCNGGNCGVSQFRTFGSPTVVYRSYSQPMYNYAPLNRLYSNYSFPQPHYPVAPNVRYQIGNVLSTTKQVVQPVVGRVFDAAGRCVNCGR